MGLTYAVKTTADLTPTEMAGLSVLFERVFHKALPEDVLRRKYRRDSCHSLMFHDGELAGAFTAIPMRFHYFGETRLFAATADLMIDPRHRGMSAFLQLSAGLYERLAQDGIAFVFCCLREEMQVFHERMSAWRRVGKVHHYVSVPLLRWNSRGGDFPAPFPIAKVNDQAFTDYRYSIFPVPYQAGRTYVYTIEFYYPIEGLPRWLRLGLLIDVNPLDKLNFDHAVAAIRKRERGLHVLVYQGRLPFRPDGMFRVPERFERQKWFLGGRILREDLVDERVFDIVNWNINLSNGDLV